MMNSTTMFRRTAVLLIGASTIGLGPILTPTASAQADVASLGAGGEYFPVAPERIYDTKDDVDSGRVSANGEITVPVVGLGGVPTDGVLAVAVNVTLVDATGRGFVSVRPSDYDASGDEQTSLINFESDGQTVPNFGIIGVGTEGALTIDISSQIEGDVRVIVDVFGWVAKTAYDGADADDGARMQTVTPERILDTRTTSSLRTQDSIEVPVRGQGPVPDDANVSAVVINMTGVNNKSNSTTTYLSASPDRVPAGQAEADSSNGNYEKGTVKANLAIVPLNDDGSIFVFNRAGRTDVLIDVVGYLTTPDAADETRTGRIVPLESPFRSFDTRSSEFGAARLGFSSWEDWSFQKFADSVSLNGVSVGEQGGLLGNVTAAGLQRNATTPDTPARSFLTLNPEVALDDSNEPTAPGNSNLNFAEGGAVANSAVITYGSNGAGDENMVSAYNSDGSTHYILDVYAVILD